MKHILKAKLNHKKKISRPNWQHNQFFKWAQGLNINKTYRWSEHVSTSVSNFRLPSHYIARFTHERCHNNKKKWTRNTKPHYCNGKRNFCYHDCLIALYLDYHDTQCIRVGDSRLCTLPIIGMSWLWTRTCLRCTEQNRPKSEGFKCTESRATLIITARIASTRISQNLQNSINHELFWRPRL